MPQTFTRVVIDGFQDGEVDFAAALQRKPADVRAEFDGLVSALVAAEGEPTNNVFWAVTIVGQADRYDVPGATIEERRARELDAATQRAHSAHDVLFTRVADALTADGAAAPATFLDATNLGIDFAIVGAADLEHPQPADEAEREQNRRVKFLAIQFSPQDQIVTFGEQDLDRAVA